MPKQTPITAVHEQDVLAFLESIGLLEAFESGALECSECGGALRDKGLGAARMRDGEVIFACADLTCLQAFHGAGDAPAAAVAT